MAQRKTLPQVRGAPKRPLPPPLPPPRRIPALKVSEAEAFTAHRPER